MFQQTGSKLSASRLPPQPSDPSPPRRSISQSGNPSVHNGIYYFLFYHNGSLLITNKLNRCPSSRATAQASSSTGSSPSTSLASHFWSDFTIEYIISEVCILRAFNFISIWWNVFLFYNRTPDGGQMTPITPSSSLGQHAPFSFAHDAATNGSPRHSIASNNSSNPPSPNVTSTHLRERDSYDSWIMHRCTGKAV